MIDAGETIQQCAERELKEETGYFGVAVKTSFIMFNGLFSFLLLSVIGLILWLRLLRISNSVWKLRTDLL